MTVAGKTARIRRENPALPTEVNIMEQITRKKQGELMPIIPQIFEHEQFGKVRIVDNNGEPWFVGKDVAEKLGYADQFGALKKHVDDEDKLVCQIGSAGQRRNVTLINEGGLYSLTVRSNLPKAKEFTRWLTHDVAISIRKHGFYIAPQAELDIKAIINPNFLRRMADELESRDKQIAELTGQVKDLKPKADYCEKILQSTEALPVTVIAKDYGMGAVQFNELLHKLEIQYKVGKTWVLYQIYAGLGYMKSVTTTLANGLSVTQTRWTQKGRMFLYSILKKAGVLPIIERESPMSTII